MEKIETRYNDDVLWVHTRTIRFSSNLLDFFLFSGSISFSALEESTDAHDLEMMDKLVRVAFKADLPDAEYQNRDMEVISKDEDISVDDNEAEQYETAAAEKTVVVKDITEEETHNNLSSKKESANDEPAAATNLTVNTTKEDDEQIIMGLEYLWGQTTTATSSTSKDEEEQTWNMEERMTATDDVSFEDDVSRSMNVNEEEEGPLLVMNEEEEDGAGGGGNNIAFPGCELMMNNFCDEELSSFDTSSGNSEETQMLLHDDKKVL